MMTPQEAREQLNQIRVADWTSRRINSAQNLPSHLSQIVAEILTTDYQKQLLAVAQLDHLSLQERLTIFELIFPLYPTQVEDAWQLLTQLPYQIGYHRRAFRAPSDSSVTAQIRHNWLLSLIRVIEGYEQGLPWLAAWSCYLSYQGDTIGILYAAAINQGDSLGEEIFQILVASAKGEHPIGMMGRHVTRSLLVSSRLDGWQLIENLLIAAQRQEGLRQVILETIDEAHPEAFKRMLNLIVQHDLTRFSATVRAIYVWLGYGVEGINQKVVKDSLTKIREFLDTPSQEINLSLLSPSDLYLALWSLGFKDAIASIAKAAELLQHPELEIRFIAAYFLKLLHLPQSQVALYPALDDPDLRVVQQSLDSLRDNNFSNYFEKLEQIFSRFPDQNISLQPLVWDWLKLEVSKTQVASILFKSLGELSPKRMLPYLNYLGPYDKRNLAKKLAEFEPWDRETRQLFITLVGDKNQWVREQVIKLLKAAEISSSEAQSLENLLTRKSPDLRRGILEILLNSPDSEVLNSAQRLLQAKQELKRQAGLELLQQMQEKNRLLSEVKQLAKTYQGQYQKFTEAEQKTLTHLLEETRVEYTLQDGLGLLQGLSITPLVEPQAKKKRAYTTKKTLKTLQSLDSLIAQYAHTTILIKDWRGQREELLANSSYFITIDPKLTREENLTDCPLQDLWEDWYQQQDDLELFRGIASLFSRRSSIYGQDDQIAWWYEARKILTIDTSSLKYPSQVQSILLWLVYTHAQSQLVDFLLDAVATTLSIIPLAELATSPNFTFPRWYFEDHLFSWLNLTQWYRRYCLDVWSSEQLIQLWHLLRYLNQFPFHHREQLEDLLQAYSLQSATEGDLIAKILQINSPEDPIVRLSFADLSTITARKLPIRFSQYPIISEIRDRCRQRIIEVELDRGDLPTAASPLALALRSCEGIEYLVKLLEALGKDKFVRGYHYNNSSRSCVFSHLIQICFPREGETPQQFAQMVQSAGISQTRLIELAFYAPQWASYVEFALEWDQFSEAVWWIHAHTKDNQWQVEQEIRDLWAAQVTERTPLSAQDLVDGAVDVQWFDQINRAFTLAQWQQCLAAAKYASGSGGHKRAELFAQALLGDLDQSTLVDLIESKRRQDAVKALGLLSIQGEEDLLGRYQILQRFSQSSRQFGSQRQASEKLATEIGLKNLAYTAGYQDPQRLEWAMETKAIADLARGPQTVTKEDTTISLLITPTGEPEIQVHKQGKAIKSIPAKLKKDPLILQLKQRQHEINQQKGRMRLSLEAAMNRGDSFTPSELELLCQHPVLSPMLQQLVFIGEGEIGYLVQGGQYLQNHQQQIHPIQSEVVKIAHSYDLYQSGEWHLWQRDCFDHQKTQPFKQIFRELYLLTAQEVKDGNYSYRYQGHQVNPRQALALWGKRQWVNYPEVGVRRTFHQENLSAWVEFEQGFYTPQDVEGLTIDRVYFTKRGEWQNVPWSEVPPRVFSEVMRDLDLVVSVAHQGGVDPETSSSTVAMRSALLGETCRLLKLTNVKIENSHALIQGELSHYSVHLGSAVVHRQPGGALCILAVPSQHRGRLFLPFADDDPKTAEVMSKVILLAKDREIKDPSILEQIL